MLLQEALGRALAPRLTPKLASWWLKHFGALSNCSPCPLSAHPNLPLQMGDYLASIYHTQISLWVEQYVFGFPQHTPNPAQPSDVISAVVVDIEVNAAAGAVPPADLMP